MENSEAKPEGLLKKIGRVGLLAGLIFNTGSKNTEKPFIEINTDQKANSEKFQDNSSIGCEIVATPGRETYAPISVLDDKNQLENCLTPIKNETTAGKLNINPEILNLMEENIKASGLEGAVNKIIIRDYNDPIF